MRRALALLAAAAAGAGAVAVITTGGDDAPTPAAAQRWTAPDRAFSVALPQGWRAIESGDAATVLARRDRRGLVVVRPRAAVTGSLDALGAGLTKQVRRQLPGARAAGTRRFRAGGRDALLTTFVRGSRVHAVAVVPAGSRRSWSLDVVAAGEGAVARDVAGLLRSFRPLQG